MWGSTTNHITCGPSRVTMDLDIIGVVKRKNCTTFITDYTEYFIMERIELIKRDITLGNILMPLIYLCQSHAEIQLTILQDLKIQLLPSAVYYILIILLTTITSFRMKPANITNTELLITTLHILYITQLPIASLELIVRVTTRK